MHNLKFILTGFVFLLAGEVVIRFDKTFKLFEQDKIVQIKTKIGESEELALLKRDQLPINESDLRILVLGDSYIYGGGIEFNRNFSHQLKKMLLSERLKNFKTVYVLDVSRPSNNNLDNYNAYFSFAGRFKPHIIILGYNMNDLINRSEPAERSSGRIAFASNSSFDPVAKMPDKVVEKESVVKKAYRILYKSELLSFSLHNIHKYLKSVGIIFPNSVFDQELSAYVKNKPEWQYSKELLSAMISDAKTENSEFIVLLLPQMDLIQYPGLFSGSEKAIQEFFRQYSNVKFMNLRDSIDIHKGREFVLSKYDEHPNEKGHLFMANLVHGFIFKEVNAGVLFRK